MKNSERKFQIMKFHVKKCGTGCIKKIKLTLKQYSAHCDLLSAPREHQSI